MKFSVAAVAATTTLVSATGLYSNNTAGSYCSKQCQPFELDLTWGPVDSSALPGRNAILSNGQFPGPPLKLTVGDCVDFTIHNHIGNDTGVHFHGIRQLDTPWSDGVPGLSQRAVPDGQSWTYRWTADAVGIYWYHSHYKSQMMDGLYGAIVVAADETTQQPFSLISNDVAALQAAEKNVDVIFASDWNRFTASEIMAIEANANIDYACIDSVILNGQGSQYCPSAAFIAQNQRPQVPPILASTNETSLTAKGCVPAANIAIQGAQYQRNLAAVPPTAYDTCTGSTGKNYTLSVDPADKYAALSFVSPAGIAVLDVAIDGHKLIVYEINGNYITPQTVDVVEIASGDRISFFIKLDQAPADYTIRVANAGINQVISGFGTLSYKGSSGPGKAIPLMNYGGLTQNGTAILNRAIAAPFPAVQVSPVASRTFNLDIMKNGHNGQSWSWVLNGNDSYSQSTDDAAPLLSQQPSTIPESDLILRTNYNEWVDLIIIISGPLAEPHPIHKHANKFFVIGSGVGAFNYSTVAAAQAAGVQFNLNNPPYLDGYTSTPSEGAPAWMAFRYQANTPGAWLLHCHIQTHLSGGMAVAILDGVDKWPTVPAQDGQMCGANNGTGNGNGTATTTGSATTSTTLGSGWEQWTSQAPTRPVGPTNTASQSALWSSINAAGSSIQATQTGGWNTATNGGHGAAPTGGAGAGPSGWGNQGSGSATTSSATGKSPVGGSGTSTWASWGASTTGASVINGVATGTWSTWAASSAVSSAVDAAATSAWSTWAASSAVDAAATNTWATWTVSASAAGAASATGVAPYNGTSVTGPISPFHGAASSIKVNGVIATGLLAGALALIM